MKKMKFIIPILILFLTIGFATINYTLSVDGDTELTGDLSDFSVYFSKVFVNEVEDNSIVTSKTELKFNGILDKAGTSYTISYDVTNGSKFFDAEVAINCSSSTEYLLVQNTFNTSDPLTSLETRTGTLLLKKLKTLASNESIDNEIFCSITATPIERDEMGSGTIISPVNPYYIGREVAIGDEKFNVISSNEDTVTMLARYNLSPDYRQSTTENGVDFSGNIGWEYTPGPKEIDIQTWSTNPKEYVNEYIDYLNLQVKDSMIKGDLITINELKNLGCTVPSDYYWNGTTKSCSTSAFRSWLDNDQNFWTKSADSSNKNTIWLIDASAYPSRRVYNATTSPGGIRPVITISKETFHKLINTYRVGELITIGAEKFNVISDNGTTISMLAKYTLGENYQQSPTIAYNTTFSNDSGWENGPEPKEIDIQMWGGEVKDAVNDYVLYIKRIANTQNVTGDLISLKQLGTLGCVIPSDYAYDTNNETRTCANSSNVGWLITSRAWWTRSANLLHAENVWIVGSTKNAGVAHYTKSYGIRPVITIDKSAL